MHRRSARRRNIASSGRPATFRGRAARREAGAAGERVNAPPPVSSRHRERELEVLPSVVDLCIPLEGLELGAACLELIDRASHENQAKRETPKFGKSLADDLRRNMNPLSLADEAKR